MKNIDCTKSLTNLLRAHEVTPVMMRVLTEKLVGTMREISVTHRARLEHLFARGWMKLHCDDLEDLRHFAYNVDEYVSRERIDEIIDVLLRVSRHEPYFLEHGGHRLSAAIDNNPDNVLFLNDRPSFIDVMPPKEEWKVADEYFTIVRNAVDGCVLGNEGLRNVVYKSYFEQNPVVPRSVTKIYEIRSGMIQWIHRIFLEQFDITEKYRRFTEDTVAELVTSAAEEKKV